MTFISSTPVSTWQCGESSFVAKSFVVTLAATVLYMTACSLYKWGYIGVWNGILLFFVVRAAQNGTRAVIVHMLGQSADGPWEQERRDDADVKRPPH